MTEITSTHELAEQTWDPEEEPKDVRSDLVATSKAEGKGIEFHVSMRDYTKMDMEGLIVEAAAMQLVGKFGNDRLAKEIEERTITLVTEKADRALASVAADIIDQPLTPKYNFAKASEVPVTMREFIGLTGRDYLMAYVDSSGKPTTDRHYGRTRIQHLVESYMSRHFKNEIEKATNAAIAEVRNQLAAAHKAFLDAEKARFREALEKTTT